MQTAIDNQQNNYYFDDFAIGRVFHTPTFTATQDKITSFAREYDPQYYHLDPVKAKESIFGGLVCGGFQTAALTWGLALQTGLFAECALAGVGIDELRWLKPVREGDVIHAEFQAIEATPSRSRPDIGRVTFLYEVKNQNGEIVLTLKMIQLLRRRIESPTA